MMPADDEIRAVTEVSERLTRTFPDIPAEAVHDTVRTFYDQFTGSPIRDFVPVLVERMARTSIMAGKATP